MSTETGHQSRGGKRRHIRLKPAPVGGGSRRRAVSLAPSARCLACGRFAHTCAAEPCPARARRERMELRAAADGEGERLARLNMELVMRQRLNDALRLLRAEEDHTRCDELREVVLQLAERLDPDRDRSPMDRAWAYVHFDRADDKWPYYAEVGRGSKHNKASDK